MTTTQTEVTDRAGVDKIMVYQSLARLYKPPERLKQELLSILGMDVWEYHNDTKSAPIAPGTRKRGDA